jgi:hypothetical protein
VNKPQSKAEEVARRGEDLYERTLRDRLEADEQNIGKIIVIDVDTGAYEIADEALDAYQRALAKRPGATLYGIRIGYDAVDGFGSEPVRTKR